MAPIFLGACDAHQRELKVDLRTQPRGSSDIPRNPSKKMKRWEPGFIAWRGEESERKEYDALMHFLYESSHPRVHLNSRGLFDLGEYNGAAPRGNSTLAQLESDFRDVENKALLIVEVSIAFNEGEAFFRDLAQDFHYAGWERVVVLGNHNSGFEVHADSLASDR